VSALKVILVVLEKSIGIEALFGVSKMVTWDLFNKLYKDTA